MGGNIATRYALDFTPKPSGLITSAGALHVKEPGVLVATVKFFSAIVPRLPVFELDDSKFSRDLKVVESMKTDPLIYAKNGPARTAAEVIGSIQSIEMRTTSLGVPLLCLHGGADEVTPVEGSKTLVEKAGAKDKTLKIYDGYFHDLLHEPGSERIVNDVRTWLGARAPANPSSALVGMRAVTLDVKRRWGSTYVSSFPLAQDSPANFARMSLGLNPSLATNLTVHRPT
jgi:alpha-beta hydrolase superfamily lysophospholipase